MKKAILIFILISSFTGLADAQEYKTGLGLRLGAGVGVSVKHFINRRDAIEGLLVTRWSGFDMTGLYEVHGEAFQTEHLNWYYGGGAHLGFYDGDHTYWGAPGYAYNIFGIDGILGLEYTFEEVPINLGLDFKPALNLIGYQGLWAEFAFSVRYTF
jgi:hypothetical protein